MAIRLALHDDVAAPHADNAILWLCGATCRDFGPQQKRLS